MHWNRARVFCSQLGQAGARREAVCVCACALFASIHPPPPPLSQEQNAPAPFHSIQTLILGSNCGDTALLNLGKLEKPKSLLIAHSI